MAGRSARTLGSHRAKNAWAWSQPSAHGVDQRLQTPTTSPAPFDSRQLNKNLNTNFHPREWGRALEALKKEELKLPNNHHGKIGSLAGYYNSLTEFLGDFSINFHERKIRPLAPSAARSRLQILRGDTRQTFIYPNDISHEEVTNILGIEPSKAHNQGRRITSIHLEESGWLRLRFGDFQ